MRRWAIAALVVGVLIVAAGYVWSQRRPPAGVAETIAETMAVPVRRGTITMTLSATGQVEAVQDKTLSFPSAGRVVEVNVAEGDRVAAGQVLVRLDDNDARLKYLQAQREYEQARTESPAGIVEEKRIALEVARKNLDATVLKAPFTGVVAALGVEPGDWVTGETTAVHLIDPEHYQVTVNLDEVDLRHVETGQDVIVRFDAFPDLELPGRVETVGWLPKQTSDVVVFPVKVVLDETDPRLRPGLTAQVEIVAEQVENALLVPLEAVVEAGPQSLVTRVTPEGQREVVPVVTGLSDGRRVEIREGLSEGDRVITNNYRLYEQLFQNPSPAQSSPFRGPRPFFGGFGGPRGPRNGGGGGPEH